jgi:multiple sugar transport system ATP-binding protein
MGRAIVRQPQAFLMDEPLSNLDAKLRVRTRAEIAKLQHDLGVTTLYVTHDQVEALTIGDRIAVMRKGQLQQVADSQELYDRPVNLFVAGFIGSPAMNLLEAKLEKSGSSYVARIGSQTLTLDDQGIDDRPALRAYEGRDVILGIRPEDLEDAAMATGSSPERHLKGTAELLEALGSEIMVHFSIDATAAMTEDVQELQDDMGEDRATAGPIASDAGKAVLVGRFNARSRVREGDAIDVAVDTRSLHFFDPGTALGIYDNPS